jgi:hypothetical protein
VPLIRQLSDIKILWDEKECDTATTTDEPRADRESVLQTSIRAMMQESFIFVWGHARRETRETRESEEGKGSDKNLQADMIQKRARLY